MQNRATNIKKTLDTTASLFKNFILPAANTVTTYLAHEAIQEVRALDPSPLKDTLKNSFSTLSSVVNMGNIGYSSYELLQDLFLKNIWQQLSPQQRMIVCASTTVCLAGASYSGVTFGVEQQTLTSGLAAVASTVGLNATHQLASFFAQRNKELTQQLNETAALLPRPWL